MSSRASQQATMSPPSASQVISKYPVVRQEGRLREHQEEGLAQFLGWFSLGLGLAELAAPQRMARLVGMDGDGELMPVMGLRELATGIGILSSHHPTEWIWGRVAGDLVDLTYLGSAFASSRSHKGRLALATLAVAGVTAFDLFCAQQLSSRPARANMPPPRDRAIHLHPTITINSGPDPLYRFWRDIENLPRIMRHLKSVTRLDDRRSRWVASAPAGTTVQWDAEIIEDVDRKRIAWRSLDGATIANSGSVQFREAAGGRGTVVDIEMQYDPPGGTLGAIVAFMFGKEPGQQIQEDLRAYKAFVETGEVPTIRGQASGRGRD